MRMIKADDLEQALRDAGLAEVIKDDCSKCTSAWGVPIVDAVEVVRCKDCKWGERTRLKQDGTDDMRYRRDYCTLYSRRHEPSYFCADGERREDETD